MLFARRPKINMHKSPLLNRFSAVIVHFMDNVPYWIMQHKRPCLWTLDADYIYWNNPTIIWRTIYPPFPSIKIIIRKCMNGIDFHERRVFFRIFERRRRDPWQHTQPTFISRKRIAARASVAFARFGSRDHEAPSVYANWSGPKRNSTAMPLGPLRIR